MKGYAAGEDRWYSLSVNGPPEFDMADFILRSIKKLSKLIVSIPMFTPLLWFRSQHGKIVPYTRHAMTELFDQINLVNKGGLKVRPHDLKRGLGTASMHGQDGGCNEHFMDPNTVSWLLHHKSASLDGKEYVAGRYMQNRLTQSARALNVIHFAR